MKILFWVGLYLAATVTANFLSCNYLFTDCSKWTGAPLGIGSLGVMEPINFMKVVLEPIILKKVLKNFFQNFQNLIDFD